MNKRIYIICHIFKIFVYVYLYINLSGFDRKVLGSNFRSGSGSVHKIQIQIQTLLSLNIKSKSEISSLVISNKIETDRVSIESNYFAITIKPKVRPTVKPRLLP